MRDSPERMVKIKITGNTFPVKDTLKAAGFKWNKTHWHGYLQEQRLVNFKKFIREHRLQCEINGKALSSITVLPYQRPYEKRKGKPFRSHQIYETYIYGGLGQKRRKKKRKK